VTAIYGFTSVFLSILDQLKPSLGDLPRRARQDIPAREAGETYCDPRLMPDDRRQSVRIREVIDACLSSRA
jgi:hypothetical protein